MQNNSNYKFEVSLSTEAYQDKVISGAMIGTTKNEENKRIRKEYGFPASKGIGFRRTEVTAASLLESLLMGKVFCHLFNPSTSRTDGTFGSSQKKDMNFFGSYVIGVDIDHTSYNSAEDFISRLTLQPTFYYTSYSNMQKNEDGTSKGARFRLIYVFNELIPNPYFFRFCAWQLNRIIETDTEELITDDCNLRCSQYFNGTCKKNPSVILSSGRTDNIYSFSDLAVDENGFIDFLQNYAYYKTVTRKRTSEIKELLEKCSGNKYVFNKSLKKFFIDSSSLFSTTINAKTENRSTSENQNEETDEVKDSEFSSSLEMIFRDWDRMSKVEFKKCTEWEKMRSTTKYVYRVEKEEWINGEYQHVDERYFQLFYYQKRQKDGEKRRKALYQRMCLRRFINPEISKDEMAVNTIIDILRFFDNSDRVLNSDFIKRNIESCFNLEITEIEQQHGKAIGYLMEHTQPKRGIIYASKKAHTKENTYNILDELYDTSISVAENLDFINNDLGFKVGKTTVYDYLANRDIKTDSRKITDEELYELIDVEKSKRDNLAFLKENGLKCSDERLRDTLRKKRIDVERINKSTIQSISHNESLFSTTINAKTENRSTSENQNVVESSITENTLPSNIGNWNTQVNFNFGFNAPTPTDTKEEIAEDNNSVVGSSGKMGFRVSVPQFNGLRK